VPELLEIEIYRREMADLVGRRVEAVVCPDPWYIRRAGTPASLDSELRGMVVENLRRHGKALLIDLIGGPVRSEPGRDVLCLRFGMTGRPLVDDRVAPVTLEYAPAAVRDEWVRFAVHFAGGGRLRVVDPRRLGGVELDPDTSRLGPDAMSVAIGQLGAACRSSRAIKTVLLDQSRIAGLGNMLVDEVLWRAYIDPARPAASLDDKLLGRLGTTIAATLDELLVRGGSHLGDLSARLRRPGSRCPRDGAELVVRQIGGRTTYSCPVDQGRT
jgi:formamidopyrimidine-DNA glycosylase